MTTDLREEIRIALGSMYRVERELTGGGMSRVFVAEDSALGRPIVIKVLPPELSGVMNVERFKREIQVAARLQHAHIVPVLSSGELNGMPYYTMPFVDGESLRQRLNRGGPMSTTEAIGVLRDVAKALAYAHDRQIIHRDIKPDNVMLAGGSAVVTDFGIAKAISSARSPTTSSLSTQIGTSLGTPAYIAPEQAAGDPEVDHRADLYSFGCMAFEMLAGRPPFVDRSVQKLFTAHMTQPAPPLDDFCPDLSASLAALVMQCLEKDPDHRPASATMILQSLETITSGGNPSLRALPSASTTGALAALATRRGLSMVVVAVAVANLLETALDEPLSRMTGVIGARESLGRAFLTLERFVSFQGHDLTNQVGAYAASAAYFFLFPVLLVCVGVALARRCSVGMYRVLVMAVAVDYLLSLPFFLLFPVPERWSVPGSGAALLSNRLSARLIEVMRPMSGIDNCFPSFHVSLTVIVVAASFIYRLRFRWMAFCGGLAVILSTFLLGIHWLADIAAGVAVGTISLALSLRLERRVTAPRRRRTPSGALEAAAVLMAVAVLLPSRAAAQTSLTFTAVALDADSRRADDRLRRYLENSAGVSFVAEDAAEYGHVIDFLVKRKPAEGSYVARVTPYALVAAELLGAHVQVLGSYVSRATSGTTYNSYLVVRRDRFAREPELSDVIKGLRRAPTPPVFAYQSEFSTSSYFLPAIYFRQNDLFDMPASTEHATAIHARQITGGSSDLVKGVATGQSDFAAVWSGTKASFEQTDSLRRYTSRVFFVLLPDDLPNDLLIAPVSMDSQTTSRIRHALATMPPNEINTGDFVTWRDINAAPEARDALANLRWLAQAVPAPLTVDVQRTTNGKRTIPDEYLVAAKHGVRLAGIEFVNFDRDYHSQQDYVLTLTPANDGAVLLRSRIVGSEEYNQEFQISFRDADGLMTRVAELLQTRIHRVRYLWPYRINPPTVLRDVDLDLRPGTPVSARMIRWLDTRRHSYTQGAQFDAVVATADADKLELRPAFVADVDKEGFRFNPMSNISYRVILPRVSREPMIFRVLTIVLLALLMVGMAAAVIEVRRSVRATLP